MPAQTAPFGSRALSLDVPTIVEPAFKPVALPAPAGATAQPQAQQTQQAQPPRPQPAAAAAAPAPAPMSSRFARTEILGSAAPAAPVMPSSAAGPHPALPPSRLEAPPMQGRIAIETNLPAHAAVEGKPPAAVKPIAHPQPPRSIANAETIITPQLPAHLGVQPVPQQLGMPPGITVAPSSPPAALKTADDDGGAFGPERHADPAEVIALHHSEASASGQREGRDVLAGWGWSTGTIEALDDDYTEDALRRGRRNLMLAIGGALGVVIIIAIVAFAFSGSKKPDPRNEHGAVTGPSPTAPIAAVTAPSHEATPPQTQPAQTQPVPTQPGPTAPANTRAWRSWPGTTAQGSSCRSPRRPSTPSRGAGLSAERLRQVGPQVLDVLDADRQPHQSGRDGVRLGVPPAPALERRLHAAE